jgi:hypothetical protein
MVLVLGRCIWSQIDVHGHADKRDGVAYLSPMDFRQLYPGFASEIGEKSAPVLGLNDVFGRFR